MAGERDRSRPDAVGSVGPRLRTTGGGIAIVVVVGFVLGFQPGWANGWGGLSKHIVWAGGMAGLAFLLLVLAGAFVLSFIGSYFPRYTRRENAGRLIYEAMMALWSVFSLTLAVVAFRTLWAAIATEWP